MYDHRDLARTMDLFHFEAHSPGMVFWHPLGLRMFRAIEDFMRRTYETHEFQEVRSPVVLSRQLWEQSGHWDKFRDHMFVTGSMASAPQPDEGGEAIGLETIRPEYAVKPMSCPAHIVIYKARRYSYRALPVRLMEFGMVHRNEPSGTLAGCMRLRQFVQDDAHIFCREVDMAGEIRTFLAMVEDVYTAFGFTQFAMKIALRPAQRLGTDTLWDKAEAALMAACQDVGVAYELAPGEGAFYGPKIELNLTDHLGRAWQCGTIQVDLNLPQIFDLTCVAPNGEPERVVMLHQAVLGAIERWLAILLESQGGALPFWLTPVQVAVASISAKAAPWAEEVAAALRRVGIRVELHTQDQTIAHKVRDLSTRKYLTSPLLASARPQALRSVCAVLAATRRQPCRLTNSWRN